MAERMTLAEMLARGGAVDPLPETGNLGLVNALAGDARGQSLGSADPFEQALPDSGRAARMTGSEMIADLPPGPWLRRWLYEQTGSALPANYLEEALGPALMSMRSASGAKLGRGSVLAWETEIPPPRSLKGVALSKNIATRKQDGMFDYGIYKDGFPVGDVNGRVAGNTANIGWLGGDDAAVNALGVSGIKQMREAFRQDFPGVDVFRGNRISGARQGPARRKDNDTKQTVRLNELAGPMAAGGGLAAYLQRLPEDEPY